MLRFQAQLATPDTVHRVAALLPENPFLTAEYVHAQETLGSTAWVLSVGTEQAASDGCLAFLRTGKLSRSLILPSTPSAPQTSPFWTGFEQFIVEQKITEFECQTYGSYQVFIPSLNGEVERVRREEFHWDLRVSDIWAGISNTHRRWIKKGSQNQLSIRRTRDDQAVQEHMILCDNSLQRRRERGETIIAAGRMYEEFSALLTSGAAELHQAMSDNVVASSILLLRAPTGVYLVSAGTSEPGRAIGASHFLVYETAKRLVDEGIRLFNLGGVRAEETGLRTYKAAFGAVPVPLVAVVATPGSGLRRSLTNKVRRIVGGLRQ